MRGTSRSNILFTDIDNGGMMEIRELVQHIKPNQVSEPPHRHTFQEIIFLQSGKGYHSIDGKIFKLVANTIYLIGQGQVHIFHEGTNLKGYILRYKEDMIPAEMSKYAVDYTLLQMLTNSNALHMTKSEASVIWHNLEELHQEHLGITAQRNTDTLQFILLTILSRIKTKIRATFEQNLHETEGPDTILHRYILLIEDHFKTAHDLEFYYGSLGINKRKLLNITREKVGKTPKEMLNNRLLTEAVRLIKYSDLSFKEICFELGYSEPAYFSRLFKTKMGKSPRLFRQEESLSD